MAKRQDNKPQGLLYYTTTEINVPFRMPVVILTEDGPYYLLPASEVFPTSSVHDFARRSRGSLTSREEQYGAYLTDSEARAYRKRYPLGQIGKEATIIVDPRSNKCISVEDAVVSVGEAMPVDMPRSMTGSAKKGHRPQVKGILVFPPKNIARTLGDVCTSLTREVGGELGIRPNFLQHCLDHPPTVHKSTANQLILN